MDGDIEHHVPWCWWKVCLAFGSPSHRFSSSFFYDFLGMIKELVMNEERILVAVFPLGLNGDRLEPVAATRVVIWAGHMRKRTMKSCGSRRRFLSLDAKAMRKSNASES